MNPAMDMWDAALLFVTVIILITFVVEIVMLKKDQKDELMDLDENYGD